MKQFIARQFIPVTIGEAWAFFSSPVNLQKITPQDMSFKIKSMPEDDMHEGMIITYRVSPFPGMNVDWVTEITHVKKEQFFVDDQRAGPFRLWHHQHHFRAVDGGVEMTDIVTYAAPFGVLGRLAEWVFVDRRVRQIFEFRKKILEDLFGPVTT